MEETGRVYRGEPLGLTREILAAAQAMDLPRAFRPRSLAVREAREYALRLPGMTGALAPCMP